jgi:arginase
VVLSFAAWLLVSAKPVSGYRPRMAGLTVVGAPTSAGAYAPGQEDGPRALREEDLIAALTSAGLTVSDAGDVAGFRWRPDPANARAANAEAVVDRARQVAERVAGVAAGERVLVLGGDCTVGVGTVAGLVTRGAAPGLVYLDRHADLNVPASTIDGALDWMGVAHMLDVDGAVEELAGVAGERPLLAQGRLAFLGLAPVTPPEQEIIERRHLPVVGLDATRADPEGAARAALGALRDRAEIAVHFDVDVVDFLDAPLAENTDRTPGLPLAAAGAALAALLSDPRVTALTVTEFNPHHGDPGGETTRRLVEVLVAALRP